MTTINETVRDVGRMEQALENSKDCFYPRTVTNGGFASWL